jgi:hypothetical protein
MAHEAVTSGNLKQYLSDVLGVTVPEFIIQAAIDKVETVHPLLDSTYAEHDALLIEYMSAAIICCAGAPRRIQSQGAASGASRSFSNDAKALSALRRSLAELDTAGITAPLVGADPSTSSMFLVV